METTKTRIVKLVADYNRTILDLDDAYEALWFAADLLDEEADATEKEEPYATKTIRCYREAASELRRFSNEI